MSYTIVGVIGHIDHGKTSLVAALTGVDTDTNPEEKRRGITIDLGFASFTSGEDQFALIDAPGHQKYIGNLLAGVASLDLGLLVVASDQGVQTQTIEHAAILRGLGVDRILVALTRCDLVTASKRSITREEVEFFLSDAGFDTLEMIETSIVTGEGIETLREHLKVHRRREPRKTDGAFRLPIDRVFSKPGRGTVAAGTLWSGKVHIGDEVIIQPFGQKVRVRDIEVHGRQVESAHAGMRTAMNLAGIDASKLRRGCELVTSARYPTTQRFLASTKLFSDSPAIKCPAEFQFHTATMRCDCRLIGPRVLEPNIEQFVIVQTHMPVVLANSQPYLLRRPYPQGSIASGKMLVPLEGVKKRTQEILNLFTDLSHTDAVAQVVAQIKLRDELRVDQLFMPQVSETEPHRDIETADFLKHVEANPLIIRIADKLISIDSVEKAKRLILERLETQAATESAWVDQKSLTDQISRRSTSTIANYALESLENDQQIVRSNRLLALKTERTSLSKKRLNALNQVIEVLTDNRTPPGLSELSELTKQSEDGLKSLLLFAGEQGTVINVGNDLYYDNQMIAAFCEDLRALFNSNPSRTVAEIRDYLQITRKYAIPLLEHFDKKQITHRSGDHRTAGASLHLIACPTTDS
ncbi:MAG: selenocysteine-specific translation elongation factor [Rubripirellula sp.]|nr:selenocysteine-specific translation elongation factor [Rubripirellula sp.]